MHGGYGQRHYVTLLAEILAMLQLLVLGKHTRPAFKRLTFNTDELKVITTKLALEATIRKRYVHS